MLTMVNMDHGHYICDSGIEDMLVQLQGMVQAAEYIHSKLVQEDLLERAFNWRVERVST